MELIYAWVEKFRNFKDVELNFSEKFIISYDNFNNCIKIIPNKNYISIYPKHVTNVNAIVGKNSVGKTNLLDVLGLRSNDRKKNNAEFELIGKKEELPYRFPNNIEKAIKHSIYFFIYYMGKDDNGQDLFCIEGNDIESFRNIIKGLPKRDTNYYKEKYWFALICNHSEEKLIYKDDLSREHIKDKLVIISFREILSTKYYDPLSTAPKDDEEISVPRRISQFQSNSLGVKIKMLYEQLQKTKRHMFLDELYKLKISYGSYYLTSVSGTKIKLRHSYKELSGKNKNVCKILESFIHYYYDTLNYLTGNKLKEEINDQLYNVELYGKSLKAYKDYYYCIVEKISNIRFKDDNPTKQHVLKCYETLAHELSTNKNLIFNGNYISLDITRLISIQEVLNVINATVDERNKSDLDEIISTFNDFFDYSIENLSDGESAYLGFFASLYEQISLLTSNKEKYIILLDEPEVRMHPELTRNFINDLILFLEDVREDEKNFQIIVSTHSPFILSDIQPTNIIYLEKDDNGNCKSVRRTVNTFGANIHSLLKDGFFMSSTMGEFATGKIKWVISSINDSSIEEVTEEEKKKWLYIINSIGDPLIQNRIMKMFNDKFKLDYSEIYNENLILKRKLKKYEDPKKVTDTITMLRKQIENLQTNITELEAKYNDKN